MSIELNLQFTNSQQVTIHLAQYSSVTVDFAIPLTAKEREAIRHYLEVYAMQYVMDIDDDEAKRIVEQLPQWGQALFDAVFSDTTTRHLFTQFVNTSSDKHFLTVTAQQPEILSLPWELLHYAGQFLFTFQPSVTILRRVLPKINSPIYAGQLHLHILFLISRPKDQNFIDPRTDAQAVLKAIENYSFITVEFLQPATLENLWERLKNDKLPPIDVIHFDGHGVFDKTGTLEADTAMQLTDIGDNVPDLHERLNCLNINANTGYLLFEKLDSYGDKGRDEFYVPTPWLICLLSATQVRLVVLSACQSAMIAHDDEGTGEEPIGSIAMGLVANGTPSVLAMSYSVMVRATELLWGKFYQAIAQGRTVGTALDEARHILLQDRKRRDLQRGQERVEIEVHDWFLPTLYQAKYQANMDAPLLVEIPSTTPAVTRLHNLPVLPATGFWGRRQELWQIENWFIDGIRRVVISGFSGQGKTFLAQELGRWLLQKGYFDAVVFVDYSGYQGLDAVQWVVTSFSSVLEQNVMDVAAVDGILQSQRILLILDNLEVYATDKQETLQELLTVAHRWSQLGDARVVITTRPVHLPHQAYQPESKDFCQLVLGGLSEQDAIDYFEQLLTTFENPMRLQRDELLHWFRKIQFHPLSLGLLARCLSAGDLANLETRLNQLLLELPNDPVKATLQLVIEQLDEESQKLLPKLVVFQGGAMEDVLLKVISWAEIQITIAKKLYLAIQDSNAVAIAKAVGLPDEVELSEEEAKQILQFGQLKLAELGENLEKLSQQQLANSIGESAWQTLKQNLLYSGLIRAENIYDRQTYFQFHPNLIATLQLNNQNQDNLRHYHQRCYYELSTFLYMVDREKPFEIRNIVKHELPNLMFAVKGALTEGTDYAIEFMNKVTWFLNSFELQNDLAQLNQKAANLAVRDVEQNWFLSKLSIGSQLFNIGDYTEAVNIFTEILSKLDTTASYNRCVALSYLGRCFYSQGQLERAVIYYQYGLKTALQLEQSKDVQRQISILYSDLAGILMDIGCYEDAQVICEQSLTIATKQNDVLLIGVLNEKIGYLALAQHNLIKAEQCYKVALDIFQRSNELSNEAIIWHQLGYIYQLSHIYHIDSKFLVAAENAYRQAVNIKEFQGNLLGVAKTLGGLASVANTMGKWTEAEAWYRKAIAVAKQFDDSKEIARSLRSLAALLQNQPNRLTEARQLAEQALAIKQTLDPVAAEIWTTYELLAQIVNKQGEGDVAKTYRRLSREAKFNFAGTRYELKQTYRELILAVVRCENTETALENYAEGRKNLVHAIHQILAGERDVEKLCEPLTYYDAPIVMTILEGIANPESLAWLEEPEPSPDS